MSLPTNPDTLCVCGQPYSDHSWADGACPVFDEPYQFVAARGLKPETTLSGVETPIIPCQHCGKPFACEDAGVYVCSACGTTLSGGGEKDIGLDTEPAKTGSPLAAASVTPPLNPSNPQPESEVKPCAPNVSASVLHETGGGCSSAGVLSIKSASNAAPAPSHPDQAATELPHKSESLLRYEAQVESEEALFNLSVGLHPAEQAAAEERERINGFRERARAKLVDASDAKSELEHANAVLRAEVERLKAEKDSLAKSLAEAVCGETEMQQLERLEVENAELLAKVTALEVENTRYKAALLHISEHIENWTASRAAEALGK